MIDPNGADQEPFPALPGTTGSYLGDSELHPSSGSTTGDPWNLDEICWYNDAYSVQPESNVLYGEITAAAQHTGSVPLPARLPSNRLSYPQSRSRRPHRLSLPWSRSPPGIPTSFPYWIPSQRNKEDTTTQPFPVYDQWWLDPTAVLDPDDLNLGDQAATPSQPIPRSSSASQVSNGPRTAGRKRSIGQRMLQCTIHDDNGIRCQKELSWEDTFRRHEDRHTESIVWPCHECEDKEFKSRAELQRHYNSTLRHRDKMNPQPRPVQKQRISERLLYCPVVACPRRRFRSLAERQDHVLHRHPEYVYRPVRPQVPQIPEAFHGGSVHEGCDSPSSTEYGASPFSERARGPQRRRNRTNSSASSMSSATIYSTGDPSPFGSPVPACGPQHYTSNDFQPLQNVPRYDLWMSPPDAYRSAGYGTAQPDAYDFTGYPATHTLHTGGTQGVTSMHPLPALLSSTHSGSTQSEPDFLLAADPRRSSSETARVTRDTVMAELTDVFDHATLGWAGGSRVSSPDSTDDDDDASRRERPRASRAIRQLQRIAGTSSSSSHAAAQQQRPSRQSFLRRVLPGLHAHGTRAGDASADMMRQQQRQRQQDDHHHHHHHEEHERWTMVARPEGVVGLWENLRLR